jgi:ribosomal protein S18 acetylase RimI-like enzyme
MELEGTKVLAPVVADTKVTAWQEGETEFPINHSHIRPKQVVRVRPYRESDRESIRRLCCDTGFLGKPVDTLFHDRELFADLFTKPYLDYEPNWAMIAEVDGRVVGYLLGSVRRHFDAILMYSGFQTTAKMVYRFLTGQYSRYPRSRQFVRWLLTSGYSEQPKHPTNSAHLHLDIDKLYRGRGIGVRLWDIFELRLKSAGITKCYGAFFSCPSRRPETAYARFGFSIFDRQPTTLFQPEITDSVEVVCVTKNL